MVTFLSSERWAATSDHQVVVAPPYYAYTCRRSAPTIDMKKEITVSHSMK